MTELERLQQRIDQLERQLAIVRDIATVAVRSFVFDGPTVADARTIPPDVDWTKPADRSTWLTLEEAQAGRGAPPASRRKILAAQQACIDARATHWEVEAPIVLPDGSTRWVLWR